MRTPSRSDRRVAPIIPIVLVSFGVLLAACSGSAAATAAQGNSAAGAPVAAPPQAAASGAPAYGVGNGSGSQSGSGQDAVIDDTKIVRTGSLQITVADTDKALLTGRDAIRGLGGYIGASQQQRKGDSIVASVTYRIPVARWEDALDAIRGLGEEVAEQTNAVEVTGQLVDIAARIRNLKASETALVGYAANAPKVSDLLEIESRLTDVRGQIEQLSAQQATLSDQAALATLTVTYGTEVVAVTEAAAQWDPAAEVDRATATLLGFGQSLASLLIVVGIVWLPILIGIAILLVVLRFVGRRLGWRRPDWIPPYGSGPPAPAAPAAEA